MIQTDLNKKGKSFRWVGGWKENEHYFNTEFVQDFCRIEGAVIVCKASHFSTEENKPKIIFDEQGNEIGIEKNAYWEIAILPNTDFIISGDNVPDGIITTNKLADKAVAIDKLNDDLQSKVNNNVKIVAQILTDSEVNIAAKNLKFRDDNGNLFANINSFNNAITAESQQRPTDSIFGNNVFYNTFGTTCSRNIFGNDVSYNNFGKNIWGCIFGNNIWRNNFGSEGYRNTFGNGITECIFGDFLRDSKVDNGVSYIELKSNASSAAPLKNIHILSGVHGKGYGEKLIINIPDEYLNSSRELIITTKVTNKTYEGPSTPDDIVMYYADEVATQNQLSEGLATIQSLTNTDIDNAIN